VIERHSEWTGRVPIDQIEAPQCDGARSRKLKQHVESNFRIDIKTKEHHGHQENARLAIAASPMNDEDRRDNDGEKNDERQIAEELKNDREYEEFLIEKSAQHVQQASREEECPPTPANALMDKGQVQRTPDVRRYNTEQDRKN
jgi:hypothetical protein